MSLNLLFAIFSVMALGTLAKSFQTILEMKFSLSFSDKGVISFFISFFACIGLAAAGYHMAPAINLYKFFFLFALLSNVASLMFFLYRTGKAWGQSSNSEAFKIFEEAFTLSEGVLNVTAGGIHWWSFNYAFKNYLRRKARMGT